MQFASKVEIAIQTLTSQLLLCSLHLKLKLLYKL